MSLALYTLGARLRAAHTGTPTPAAAYSPAIPPLSAIAVTVDTDGDHTYLTATDGERTLSGTDRHGLDVLAQLGATMTDPRRTLIVGTGQDMRVLTALARTYPNTDASPVIGWWDERIDFPGTDAVHVVTENAARRWVLGVHPDLDNDPATWARWLGVHSTGAAMLYDLARLTTTGPLLPGLLHASVLDTASWDRYGARLKAGRRWWAKDTRTDAALGLISRSHSAEWYDSLRLDDPRVAVAASHDGTIVPGVIVGCDPFRVTVAADRPLSRLRVDAKVTAWHGEPINAGGADCLTGVVDEATIDTASRLTIALTGVPVKARKALSIGDRITLRPSRVDPNMQTTARRLASSGYRRGTNWIAGRGTPISRRGDVPLDVIVAAADD